MSTSTQSASGSNRGISRKPFQSEFGDLIGDCTPAEIEAIFHIVLELKAVMHQNKQERQFHAVRSGPQWLRSIAANAYDGFFCSNVLDVIPTETALEQIW